LTIRMLIVGYCYGLSLGAQTDPGCRAASGLPPVLQARP
jgi:hypothetical protein